MTGTKYQVPQDLPTRTVLLWYHPFDGNKLQKVNLFGTNCIVITIMESNSNISNYHFRSLCFPH
jgi:hypothetical protein